MATTDVSPPSSTQRALLLDFDGTLAETLPILREIYERFLAEIDAVGQAPAFAAVTGANLGQLIPDLCRQFSPQRDAASAWQEYWADVERGVLTVPPAAGARALMTWGRQQGWRLGIATASRTALITAWLARHDLAGLIDDVVGADMCEQGKPDPAIYRLLAQRLGVSPHDCIAVEDSTSGIRAAQAAGIDVIGLGIADQALAGISCRAATLQDAHDYLMLRFERTRAS